MNDDIDFKKRRILSMVAALIGSTAANHLLSSNALAKAVVFNAKANSEKRDGLLFTQPQMLLLRDICRTVIPATETPGADELDCHGFIDSQLFYCYPKSDHQTIQHVLDKIDKGAVRKYGVRFSESTAQQQQELLIALEQKLLGFDQASRDSFKRLKYFIVFGYYTSEVGASKELAYDRVPRGYTPDVKFSEKGKDWGSLTYYW